MAPFFRPSGSSCCYSTANVDDNHKVAPPLLQSRREADQRHPVTGTAMRPVALLTRVGRVRFREFIALRGSFLPTRQLLPFPRLFQPGDVIAACGAARRRTSCIPHSALPTVCSQSSLLWFSPGEGELPNRLGERSSLRDALVRVSCDGLVGSAFHCRVCIVLVCRGIAASDYRSVESPDLSCSKHGSWVGGNALRDRCSFLCLPPSSLSTGASE